MSNSIASVLLPPASPPLEVSRGKYARSPLKVRGGRARAHRDARRARKVHDTIEMELPNATEVAGRLLALRTVVTYAMAEPGRTVLECEYQSKQFWDAVKSSPIFPYLSTWEREFATTTVLTMSEQQHLDALWRLEAAQVLMWALCLIPELPAPDKQADLDLSKVEILNRPTSFLSTAVLRTRAETDVARDIAELWHWRSRTEQLIREGPPFVSDEEMVRLGLRSYQDVVRLAVNAAYKRGAVHLVIGDDFAVKNKSYAELSLEEWSEIRSISVERHRALNWLCGYSPNNDWDQTPTNT